SHELRTPLNSILGFTQILQRDSAMPEQHQDALATILRSGSHLLSLIDGLLDVAKIEAGKLRLELTEIPFPELIHDLEQMFTPQAEDKGLRFRLDCVGKIPAVVRGDEKRVRQILINLLGNAINFTDSGEVRLRVSYMRETANFEIIDTGIGIDPEQIERIFQPFERGDLMRQDKGVGLGLTITRMLTSLMGGELRVVSELDKGTCFQVRLFLSQVRVPQAVVHVEHDIIGYHGERRRILVVDDHVDHRKVLSGMLTPLGFEVSQASNGQEAIRQVALLSPDLILMDLSMPTMDGWATSRMIRRNALSAAPIIIISANAFTDDRERSIAGACNDYLAKPVRTPELLGRLQLHLDLQWLRRRTPLAAPVATQGALPSAEELAVLAELSAIGYVRGLHEKLDAIVLDSPGTAPFINKLRALLKSFRLEELNRILKEAEDECLDPQR
ncbi:MAG: ATP-binding protein, partial [Pseudomonas sp.]